MYSVALDIMGGDYAPSALLKGAELALKSYPDLRLLLVGKYEYLKATKRLIKELNFFRQRIHLYG